MGPGRLSAWLHDVVSVKVVVVQLLSSLALSRKKSQQSTGEAAEVRPSRGFVPAAAVPDDDDVFRPRQKDDDAAVGVVVGRLAAVAGMTAFVNVAAAVDVSVTTDVEIGRASCRERVSR